MENYDVAAILECNHANLDGRNSGDSLEGIGLKDYKVIKTCVFKDQSYTKAIAIKNMVTNEVYVHYYGTGDGNWKYNAAAYGAEPQPSEMQEWALTFFDDIVKTEYEGKSMGSLYVTGHSQGGNNAQFVTIRSEYSDYISQCISLDGPGFSYKFVEDSKKLLGEAVYESRCDKIWGYYGENDYVSTLGQVSIVKTSHIRYVRYTMDKFNFAGFHMIDGMVNVDDDGNIRLAYDPDDPLTDDSAFRKFITKTVSKIKDLPQEKQARAAELVMKICEDNVGSDEPGKSYIKPEELKELKELLVPFLVEVPADDPEQLAAVLIECGMSTEAAEAIVALIKHINTYSVSEREIFIAGILEFVQYDYENSKIKIDLPATLATIPGDVAVIEILPIIWETAATHPDDIMDILHECKVDKLVEGWIENNPWKFTGICTAAVLFTPIWKPLANTALVTGVLLDAGIRIVQAIDWIDRKIIEAVVKTFTALKNVITSLRQWYRNTFNAGVKYVADNPYFKVNTQTLRDYATRIGDVNRRLGDLDGELRGLYWQVGFTDLWDILCANLLTSESPTLNQVKYYLNNSATRLENAERRAESYMGG